MLFPPASCPNRPSCGTARCLVPRAPAATHRLACRRPAARRCCRPPPALPPCLKRQSLPTRYKYSVLWIRYIIGIFPVCEPRKCPGGAGECPQNAKFSGKHLYLHILFLISLATSAASACPKVANLSGVSALNTSADMKRYHNGDPTAALFLCRQRNQPARPRRPCTCDTA